MRGSKVAWLKAHPDPWIINRLVEKATRYENLVKKLKEIPLTPEEKTFLDLPSYEEST